ncbi:unnamed protein product [Linum trigynum]|uniref:Uncharacterized protein n=1 Tax=Linum trigynum TaxID=586398 RepID=A0AAV2CVK1_9ROSI
MEAGGRMEFEDQPELHQEEDEEEEEHEDEEEADEMERLGPTGATHDLVGNNNINAIDSPSSSRPKTSTATGAHQQTSAAAAGTPTRSKYREGLERGFRADVARHLVLGGGDVDGGGEEPSDGGVECVLEHAELVGKGESFGAKDVDDEGGGRGGQGGDCGAEVGDGVAHHGEELGDDVVGGLDVVREVSGREGNDGDVGDGCGAGFEEGVGGGGRRWRRRRLVSPPPSRAFWGREGLRWRR